jgi:hypothetical protein
MPERAVITDPEHWRKRAEEMRALSKEMNSAEGRRMLLKLAAEYEELAKIAEERKRQPDA